MIVSDDEEVRIGTGRLQATVGVLGATLVGAEIDGFAILDGPGAVEPSLGHHGAVLAPWPNRVDRGRYSMGGHDYQLPVNDPRFGHALHGFAFERPWRVVRHDADAVSLSLQMTDEPGYPFEIALTVTYRIKGEALGCTAQWKNTGSRTAPFGLGFHPYFVAGPSTLDEWLLKVPSERYFDADQATALPTRQFPTAGGPYDFNEARPVGDRSFSRTFGGLHRHRDGNTHVHLSDPHGVSLSIELSTAFRWVQVFTGDLPTPAHHRRGLAIEPQTCPPNAFVNGIDLLRLRPGEGGAARWSVRVSEHRERR